MILIIKLVSVNDPEIKYRLEDEGLEEFHIGIKWLATWFA